MFESRFRYGARCRPAREAFGWAQARIASGRLVADADVPVMVHCDDAFADGLQHGDALQIQVGDFRRLKAKGQPFEAAGDDHGAQYADHAHADDVHERLVQVC